jgi:hypothetical protein
MKLTHFKSNHKGFILDTEIQNYTIIKMDKLKVSFDERWQNEQMKSRGKNGSGKLGAFIPNRNKFKRKVHIPVNPSKSCKRTSFSA